MGVSRRWEECPTLEPLPTVPQRTETGQMFRVPEVSSWAEKTGELGRCVGDKDRPRETHAAQATQLTGQGWILERNSKGAAGAHSGGNWGRVSFKTLRTGKADDSHVEIELTRIQKRRQRPDDSLTRVSGQRAQWLLSEYQRR